MVFLFAKIVKHVYCDLSWTYARAAVQAAITGMVLIRKPFLPPSFHAGVDSKVQELHLSLNLLCVSY